MGGSTARGSRLQSAGPPLRGNGSRWGCRVGGDVGFGSAPLRRHATLYAPCRHPAGTALPAPSWSRLRWIWGGMVLVTTSQFPKRLTAARSRGCVGAGGRWRGRERKGWRGGRGFVTGQRVTADTAYPNGCPRQRADDSQVRPSEPKTGSLPLTLFRLKRPSATARRSRSDHLRRLGAP